MPAKNKEAKGLILAALGESPGLTKADLVAATGLTEDVVNGEIGRLRRTNDIKAEQYGRHKVATWHLNDGLSILDRIEEVIRDSAKALNYHQIAAMLGISQAQTANPLSVLVKRRKIIKSEPVRLATGNAASTYVHADNIPIPSRHQGTADQLGISLEIYEQLIDKELGEPLCDAEFRNWLNVYHQGSGAKAQFLGS